MRTASFPCSDYTLATLALCVPMILWGSSFIALKLAVNTFDPMVMVFGRMLSSLLVLTIFWLLVYRGKRSLLQDVTSADKRNLVWVALCEPCFYFIFEGYALRYTTASQAGMIAGVLPLIVVIAAWLFLKERPTLRVWCGFILAVVGVISLSWGAEATETSSNPILGNILELCAMLCGAMYLIFAKRLSPACSPLLITGVQSLVGTLFFLPLLFLPTVSLPTSFPLLPTLAVLYLGMGVTLFSFIFYNYAIRRLPASRTGALLNLVPVIALFMGVLFLDETLSPAQWLACLLVFTGILVSQWKTQSDKSPS